MSNYLSNEVILKKSVFGGFKRADVLNYVEFLQQENYALKTGADENLRALPGQKAALEEEKALLMSRVNELSGRVEALESELAAEKEKSAESGLNPVAGAEEKSNAVIKDAVKYADSIVAAAKQSAAGVLAEAKGRIDSAAQDIRQANERAKTAQNNLDHSLSSVKDSVDSMLECLGGLKDELSEAQ